MIERAGALGAAVFGSSTVGQSVASTQNLTPAQKAQVILTQAQNDIAGKLWRAALGEADQAGTSNASPSSANPLSMEALLSLLEERGAVTRDGAAGVPQVVEAEKKVDATWGQNEGHSTSHTDYESSSSEDQNGAAGLANGPNARFAGFIGQAASRTGIPASALATIVNAEAAKGADGRWLAYSRNPRSSAAGLGQFLNGTWVGEAERKGTWLNGMAEQNGWLNSRGHVRGENKTALLALRYDPQASIEAVADYAQTNLASLRRSGVKVGAGVTQVAQSAYLAHHLGIGDAVKFLSGGLSADRARTLLKAQVGVSSANSRIDIAGNAVAAHRTWLMDYVNRNIRPDKLA